MGLDDRWPWLRGRRGILAAVVVAGVLRLVWVIVVTRASPNPFADSSEYIGMALEFGSGRLPRFHGGPSTAWFPPGYPLVLAPLLTLADATGVVSPVFAASLVNAVAGTMTVGLTGLLAEHWISRRAGYAAAWMMALAPAQIYFTSTAHSETVFTLFVVTVVLLVSRWTASSPSARCSRVPIGWQVGIGALIGFTSLVRSPGLVLLFVPPLVLHAAGRSWSRSLRVVPGLACGAVLVLSPWAVRNGVQVGHWSPFSTNNASAVCIGHHPAFMADYDPVEFTIMPEVEQDCFSRSPYDDPRLGFAPPGHVSEGPDEAAWYRQATSFGFRSALQHPAEEIRWTASKLRSIVLSEDGAVEGARNFGEGDWAGDAEAPLMWLAVVWLLSVEALAVVGAIRMRCRPGVRLLTGCAVVFLVLPVIAVAYPHQHYPAMPFLVVLASGVVAGEAGRRVPNSAPALGAGEPVKDVV